MSQDFIDHIDDAVGKLNYSDRAKLIREAIAEKLEREGIPTSRQLAAAPARVTLSKRPLKTSVKMRRAGA